MYKLLSKGFLAMDQKNNEQKTAQILYITIIMVLLILALTVGLVTAANRKNNQNTPIATVDTTSGETTPRVTTAKTTVKVPFVKEPVATTAPKAQTVAPPAITSAPKPTVAEPAEETLPMFFMPAAGSVSNEFSIDTLVYSNTMEDYRTHNGIDISTNTGSAVMAAADGTVTDVYEHPMMGYTVEISHSADAVTVYQNLGENILVSIGDKVKCGDTLGAVGESALIEIAEEPHLHFEMCIAGKYVNPADYISFTEDVFYEE